MALFKGENRHESMSMVIGTVLLVFGIVLLMVGFYFAFSILSNPRGYLESQMPGIEDTSEKGPRAEFGFTLNDLTVSFEDRSQSGDASIVSWQWDFGDEQSASGSTPPSHTYMSNFSGNVRLTVRDSNDKESSALGNIQARPGEHTTGNSMPDVGDIASNFNMGDLMGPLMALPSGFIAIFLAFLMLFIIWLVGASILKAGWNLIRPRPETIRVRIKPKDLQVEPVYPTTYATQPQAPPPPIPPPYMPPQNPPAEPPPPP